MTRKRYIKLFYALMQKINAEHIRVCGKPADEWGKVLRGVRRIKFGADWTPETTSYAEAWENLRTIRQQYGM
jgi:hypothetical protein